MAFIRKFVVGARRVVHKLRPEKNDKIPLAHEKLEEKQACMKQKSEQIINIDEGDIENELAVLEYVSDIYKFYKVAEVQSRLQDYMGAKPDIKDFMLSILVNWLVQVQQEFKLRPETLFLSVNITDRFLFKKLVSVKELQLVGVASMLIASKYEEISPPEVDEFVQIADWTYASEQVLAMEKSILESLDWCITVPTPYMFLPRFVKASTPADSTMENMVFFYAELGITNYTTSVNYLPSLLAASSVYAARLTLRKYPSWTVTLEHYTDYSEFQLRECARLLVSFHSAVPDHRCKAVHRKFSRTELGSVSLQPPTEALLI